MKGRLEYVDALRGVAILLVVYVHLVSQGLYYNKGGWEKELYSLATGCMPFRMALFFFISGLFAYTLYDTATLRKRVANRLTRQLWPTLAICALFNALFFWKGWENLIFNRHNAGYWFTQSLVQTFIFYAVTAWGMERMRLSRGAQTVVICGIIGVLVWLRRHLFGDGHIGAFYMATYLVKTIQWAPFFLAGVVMKMWFAEVIAFIEREWWVIGGIAAYYICGLVWKEMAIPELMAASGVAGIYILFHQTRGFWGSNGLLLRGLRSLGKQTLPIYLYHYMIIQPICTHRLLGGLKWVYGKPWAELPLIMGIAIGIAAICVVTDRCIKRGAPWLHGILYNPMALRLKRKEEAGLSRA